MGDYHHLTTKEREQIMLLCQQGKTITQIALELGRNKSTISRELKRNSSSASYSACEATAKYCARRTACHRKYIFGEREAARKVSRLLYFCQWSPEEIANRLKLEDNPLSVSYATIYRAIYRGQLIAAYLPTVPSAVKTLRHNGKRRRKKPENDRRGYHPFMYELKDRPEAANDRRRVGDWEADTVLGKIGKQCLLTLTDRKTRMLFCCKVEKKTAANVAQAIIKLLKDQPCESITPDRGCEFYNFEEISNGLNGVKIYYPEPQQPWQRGTNENTNGLLREYFPKGEDITDIPDDVIQMYVNRLNCRPKKCLGWKSPYEVYYSTSLHLT